MADVTPQSLCSFEFYELLTKKITLFAIAVQPSLGWEMSPRTQATRGCSATAQQRASGLLPAGATDCCREAKYDFSLSCQPALWDKHFSFSEKHHCNSKSQLVWPVDFSLAWWVFSPALLQFPILTEGLFQSPPLLHRFLHGWIRSLQRRVSSTEAPAAIQAAAELPGSHRSALALGRGTLAEITWQSGASTTLFLIFFYFFFLLSEWKGNRRQRSKKKPKNLVFRYSRNWEPNNNSATRESVQPSGDCDTAQKKKKRWRGGGGREGIVLREVAERRDLKNEGFISMLSCILHTGWCFNVEQRRSLSGFVHQRRTCWST